MEILFGFFGLRVLNSLGKLNVQYCYGMIVFFSIFAQIGWVLFDKYLWKNKLIKMLIDKFTKYTAVEIYGRWEGDMIRDNVSHEFILEIRQTFSDVSCKTFTTHSDSKSITADIIIDPYTEDSQLIFNWSGCTKNTGSENPHSGNFDGVTILNIISEDEMTGKYYTDRPDGQTRGTIHLSKTGSKLNNRFD